MYRVIASLKTEQLGLIVDTAKAALQLIEDFFDEGAAEVQVRDIDGNIVELDDLKSRIP